MAGTRNWFGFFAGKCDDISSPTFVKPFTDRMKDVLALSRKVDISPENTKPIFRAAMKRLEDKCILHGEVRDVLLSSSLPVLLLHDVHFLTKGGSGSVDYVILSNRFIIALSCETAKEGEEDFSHMDFEERENALVAQAENNAELLSELLSETRSVSRRAETMVWPMIVMTSEPVTYTNPEAIIASGKKQDKAMRKEHHAQFVTPENLSEAVKEMFKTDDLIVWLTNKEVHAVAAVLMKCDSETMGSPVSERTVP